MSGPENFEDEFGKEWREAFDGYTQTPPNAVWENIDKKLTYQKMVYYKRSARIFQYLSAAILLLAGFLGIYTYSFSQNNQLRINDFTAEINHPIPLASMKFGVENSFSNLLSFIDESDSECKSDYVDNVQLNHFVNNQDNNSSFGSTGVQLIALSNVGQSMLEMVDIEALEGLSSIAPNLNVIVASNIENHEVWKLADYSYLSKEKKVSDKKKVWAGFDAGASSFNPNYQSAGNTTLNNSLSSSSFQFSGARTDAVESQSPQIEESMSVGNTVSLGLNFGLNLSEKWSISSGFRYNLSEATNSTNVIVRSTKVQEAIPASQEFKNVSQVNNAVSASTVLEYDFQDVELSNEFQFASLPVKAGYMIYNKKLRIELNAGIAANFYLGNKLSSSDKQFADVSIGPGHQSAYKEISFSGLAGIPLGYLFLEKFEVIIQPNYQQTINSLTKEAAEFDASPSGFGVSTGLRYRFN
jgi:hypothetical protein